MLAAGLQPETKTASAKTGSTSFIVPPLTVNDSSSAFKSSDLRNRGLQVHAQRDRAVDGIHAQRREEVPVRFAARWIGKRVSRASAPPPRKPSRYPAAVA